MVYPNDSDDIQYHRYTTITPRQNAPRSSQNGIISQKSHNIRRMRIGEFQINLDIDKDYGDGFSDFSI